MGENEFIISKEEKLVLFLINKDYCSAIDILHYNNIDLKKLIDLLRRHSITLIIFTRIVVNLHKYFSAEFIATCKIAIVQQQLYNDQRRKELKRIALLLRRYNYPLMTIKGFIFEDIEEGPRMFSDVDLLIDEENLRDVLSLIEGHGYTYRGPKGVLSIKERTETFGQLNWNNQFPYKCPNMDFNFEIHTNLFERDRIRYEKLDKLLNNIALFWDHKIWNEKYSCHTPCLEATLALLCLHTSLKRSLASMKNPYLLRHVIDMEAILEHRTDREYFLSLCKTWGISYHAYFAMRLYENIMMTDTGYTEILVTYLKKSERLLARIHLSCWKDLYCSKRIYVFLYNFLMPFIIGGGLSKSLRWYLYVLFPTRVQQEHVYGKYGFRKESLSIYITYLINPFRLFYNTCIKAILLKFQNKRRQSDK